MYIQPLFVYSLVLTCIQTINRLLVPKLIFKGGSTILKLESLSRQPQYSAILGHVFADMDEDDYKPCNTCASRRSEGPWRTCVYDEGGLFQYACTNCQSKSNGSSCSIRGTLMSSPVHTCT